MNRTGYITLFLLISIHGIAQIKIEIQNEDIDDVCAISVCVENNEDIKGVKATCTGKTLFVETNGYNKIRLSHIGYYDTALVIGSSSESHTLLLRPKVIELNEVIVKDIKPFVHVDKKKGKSKTMSFALNENTIWYFEIDLSHLDVKELYEVNVELSNICREDDIAITLYGTLNDAVNNAPFYKKVVALEGIDNKILKVFDHTETNLTVAENFILGLKIIPIKPDRPIKPTFVVTAFQNKETQIYYQNEKNSISKMPNEYFLRHFDGYPLLVKTVKYGK